MIPSNKIKIIITSPTNFLYRFYQVKTFIFSLCLLYQPPVLIKNDLKKKKLKKNKKFFSLVKVAG